MYYDDAAPRATSTNLVQESSSKNLDY